MSMSRNADKSYNPKVLVSLPTLWRTSSGLCGDCKCAVGAARRRGVDERSRGDTLRPSGEGSNDRREFVPVGVSPRKPRPFYSALTIA